MVIKNVNANDTCKKRNKRRQIAKVRFLIVFLFVWNVAFAQDESQAEINYPYLHNSAENQLPFAEAGDPLAQYLMSYFYMHGDGGVKQNIALAAKWLEKSANQQYLPAQFVYASNLFYGLSENSKEIIKQDKTRAVDMLRKLADVDGDNGVDKDKKSVAGKSAFLLGEIYAEKESRNIKESLTWYEKAAELDNNDAKYILGLAYANQKLEVEENPPKAAAWWTHAAGQGHALSQYALGWAYSEGYGVEQSQQEAVKWWRISAAQGNEDSINALKERNLK